MKKNIYQNTTSCWVFSTMVNIFVFINICIYMYIYTHQHFVYMHASICVYIRVYVYIIYIRIYNTHACACGYDIYTRIFNYIPCCNVTPETHQNKDKTMHLILKKNQGSPPRSRGQGGGRETNRTGGGAGEPPASAKPPNPQPYVGPRARSLVNELSSLR